MGFTSFNDGEYQMELQILTSSDPEPPVGTIVWDSDGWVWMRHDTDRRCWFEIDTDDGRIANGDPESWTRVAGNHGPVQVLSRNKHLL